MKKIGFLISGVAVVTILGFSESGFPGFLTPENFPEPVYGFRDNPVTEEGFELGRALFYETALSRDNTISCGSCHIQGSGFTQHGHDLSHGIDDRLGSRNSPPIMNLAWSRSFFWDGGIFHLDLLPISPITNPVEMDETMEGVISKLSSMPHYRERFKKAFGSDEVTGTRVFRALSQYMVMCVSSDSKYDSIVRGQDRSFTTSEKAGYMFFKRNCAACHTEPLFTDGSFRNNGLSNMYNKDPGRYLITLDPTDKFKFKVPSLRNLSYTAPYMHDGRFSSLDEVLDHYSTGISDMPGTDPLLARNGRPGIVISDEDRKNLIAFLLTLDDKRFITRRDLSEP